MELKNINIFAGNENLMRCWEICEAGDLKMFLVNSEYEDTKLSPHQFNLLKEHLMPHITDIPEDADIFSEAVRPDISSILRAGNMESKADISKRVKAAFTKIKGEVNTLEDSGASLLNTAYNRLQLEPYEVHRIIRMAAIIAKLDDPETANIGTHHIAEAIQYRSVDRRIKEKWQHSN
jgi:hypothetical protein